MPLVDTLQAWRHDLLRDVAQMIANSLGSYRAPIRVVNIPLVIGSRGVALAANDNVYFYLGLNGTLTIVSWSLAGMTSAASVSGTVTIDVLVGTTLATVASICGGSPPALSSQAELVGQLPTGWTTAIADPRWICAKISSVSGGLEEAALTLRCVVDAR
jgi:hypothetical protein